MTHGVIDRARLIQLGMIEEESYQKLQEQNEIVRVRE
jgi:hypothetical protein